MDQVEFTYGHLLALQIVAGDGEIGGVRARQAAYVDISGQDRTAAGHPVRQPCRHRPTARARLPAPPASSQPELPDGSLADRIKLAFQRRKAFILPAPRPRESVPAHLLILPAARTANRGPLPHPLQPKQPRPAPKRPASRPGSRPSVCITHRPRRTAKCCRLRMVYRSGGPDDISGDGAWPNHNPSLRTSPPFGADGVGSGMTRQPLSGICRSGGGPR